jgi:hypothetical protein
MMIDNLPQSIMVDKDGRITPEWRNSLQQTITQLQTLLGNEAYILPQQPNPRAQTQNITALNTQVMQGGMHYNSVNNAPAINIKQYPSSLDENSPNTFQFVPVTTYNEFADIPSLNAVPTSTINGKWAFVSDGSHNNSVFVGVNNQWRELTLT